MNRAACDYMNIKPVNHSGKNILALGISSDFSVPISENQSESTIKIFRKDLTFILRGTHLEDSPQTGSTLWTIDPLEGKTLRTSGSPCTATEHELNAIIESVSEGIYVTDGEGKTLRVNSAFQRITGIKAEDVEGVGVDDLIKNDVFRKSATLSVLNEKRQISMIETLKIGKEVLLTGTPVFDDEGNIFRVVTTLRDIKRLNNLQKQLAEFQEKTELYEKEVSHLRLQQMNMEDIVINSPKMHEIVETAIRMGGVNTNILISGESGVGKEIIAKIIHKAGTGENSPLITCNCSAIPESLIESELFGYEGGAFTGAKKEGSPGMFELAKGGTLFLDEIGELSLNFQAKFLRAIQEKEITRVGGTKSIKLDFRLIAATNRDLEEMVRKRMFRSDLFYRLNVVPISIPPLRERKDSITAFVYKFLEIFNKQFNRNVQISPEALQLLEDYDWPGNVRELKNIIERMVVLVVGNVIRENDVPAYIKGLQMTLVDGGITVNNIMPLKKAIADLESQLLEKTYKKYKSTRKAAEVLGISQSQISRKLGRYGIYEE